MNLPIALAWTRRIFDIRKGAIAFTVKTAMAAWLSDLLILIPLLAVKYYLDQSHEAIDRSSFSLLGILIVAPLLENIVFIGLIEFLKMFDLKDRTIVLCVAVISGIAHMIAGGLRAISGAIGFAIMSYSYLLWKESAFLKRYMITVMQHVLMNTPPALALLLLD